MKNMQNEPNLQNSQINVTAFLTTNYGNFRRPSIARRRVALAKMEASGEGGAPVTNFTYKVQMHPQLPEIKKVLAEPGIWAYLKHFVFLVRNMV